MSKAKYGEALVNYVMHQGLRHQLPRPSVQLCKTMLPWLHHQDRRWAKVDADQFNPQHYLAHKRFYEKVRNLLDSKVDLERMLKAAKEELDDQADQE